MCASGHDVTHSKEEGAGLNIKTRREALKEGGKEKGPTATHIDAEGGEVVRVVEVVRDWLSQVEGQLDELEGGAGIRGGEDDPAAVVHDRNVRRQYHLNEGKLIIQTGS